MKKKLNDAISFGRNNGYDLSKYDERLVNGLRLREQDIEEGKLKTYVDNMLRLMK